MCVISLMSQTLTSSWHMQLNEQCERFNKLNVSVLSVRAHTNTRMHTPTHTQTPTSMVSISILANVLSALVAAIRSRTKCLLVLAVPLRPMQPNELPLKDKVGVQDRARDADEAASTKASFP